MYAQVVFPLPFRNAFTYSVPKDFAETVQIGVRVVVPFGKRVLTGFVVSLSETTDVTETKPIRDVLDENPIFDELALKFYEWISEYYLSSLGEALRNSVPYGSDVESKRKVVSDCGFCSDLLAKEKKKTSTRAKLLERFAVKEIHRIFTLQKEIKKKSIYSILRTLEKEGAITVLNEIEDAKVRVKKVKYVKLAKSADEIYEFMPEIESSSPKQVVILLELLANKTDGVQQSELLKKTNTHQASINSLVSKELVEVYDKEIDRVYSETYEEKYEELTLTPKQKEIVDEIEKKINEKVFLPYLLYGITGSGKTQIYIELAKLALKKDKNVLILVPEISLTPQITSRFINNLGESVAVMHSRLSLGERYDTWRGIIAGKYKVVIGPRSALFAPLKEVGLIVVDEEHDQSYKQFEIVPKYHARDAAIIKARFCSCPVVLGSATPSIESMYNGLNEKYKLLELLERIDGAEMPDIKLVDITIEKKMQKMEGAFSKTLLDEIDIRLKKKESVIILQNRRGFSTQVYCQDCGEVVACDDCSVSMVHHINRNILQCHYCNTIKPVPKACPTCGSISLKFTGTGTQKVEDELAYYFPNAKIERIDSDSIDRKGKLGLILNSFRKGEIDILVGTQMVSKGLDFANVTLVGVISAETTLWLPDFRADERTFQLLTQVSGRAGRSKLKGEVLIQTQNSKNFVLQKVLLNDYSGFYAKEIQLRQQGGYPPFARLCLIEFKDEKESDAKGAAIDFYNYLKNYQPAIYINPPNPAVIARIKGQYRYQILVKSFRDKDMSGKVLRHAVLNSFIAYNQKSKFRDVKLIIDVDPHSVL
jgi:primosomal protein N' (replication factor Y)